MVPLEDSVTGELYYKDENGEYKKIGGVPESIFVPCAAEEAGVLYCGTIEVSVNVKTFKKKRFKKLLMAKGHQRNSAEFISNNCARTAFDLIFHTTDFYSKED